MTIKKFSFIFLLGIYLLTRLPFLVFQPVYYDSFEYVRAIKNVLSWQQILPAIRSTHQPIHTAYIGAAAILRVITHVKPTVLYTIMSVFFGLLGAWCWYLVLQRLYRNTETAFWGTCMFILFPGLWRTSTNILYESMLIVLQAGTMLMISLLADSENIQKFFGTVVLFVGAQLVFIGNIFSVIPIAILGILLKLKNKWVVAWITLSAIFALLIDYLALGSSAVVTQKYLSHFGDTISPQGGFLFVIARIIRNLLMITSTMVYPIPALLSIPALWKLRKDKNIFIISLIFFLCSFLTMQYWHAGFFGRIGIFIVFPVSLVLAKLFKDRPFVGVVTSIILVGNIFVLGWQQRQIPYIQALTSWVQLESDKNNNALFIAGDYTRFAYEQTHVNLFTINDPQNEIKSLRSEIEQTKSKNGKIFVDSSALSYPYNLPDGWQYQLLSKQKKNGLIMEYLSKNCKLDTFYTYQSIPPLIIFQIQNCKPYTFIL